ncbi:MAG: hypothetical protein K2Y14_05840, partial [Burkholderiales bacterium]|nr:hypothetical protein [Burkholderiales bacterium]
VCGIAGFIDQYSNYVASNVATSMGNALYTRVQDGSDVYSDDNLRWWLKSLLLGALEFCVCINI